MKPKTSIRSNPHLPVKNLRETLNCYRDILGFCNDWTWTGKNGNETDDDITWMMYACFGEDPALAQVLSTVTPKTISCNSCCK